MTMQSAANITPSGRLDLALDADKEITRIAEALRSQVLKHLRRRGIVLGLSGGIDSSVTAALAVRAVGAGKTLGVLMPERDSDPESLRLGKLVADAFGIPYVIEDIGPILDAAGCYRRRDEAIRRALGAQAPVIEAPVEIMPPDAVDEAIELIEGLTFPEEQRFHPEPQESAAHPAQEDETPVELAPDAMDDVPYELPADAVEAAAAELRAAGTDAIGIRTDVSDRSQVLSLIHI